MLWISLYYNLRNHTLWKIDITMPTTNMGLILVRKGNSTIHNSEVYNKNCLDGRHYGVCVRRSFYAEHSIEVENAQFSTEFDSMFSSMAPYRQQLVGSRGKVTLSCVNRG